MARVMKGIITELFKILPIFRIKTKLLMRKTESACTRFFCFDVIYCCFTFNFLPSTIPSFFPVQKLEMSNRSRIKLRCVEYVCSMYSKFRISRVTRLSMFVDVRDDILESTSFNPLVSSFALSLILPIPSYFFPCRNIRIVVDFLLTLCCWLLLWLNCCCPFVVTCTVWGG
jgi:hypothetical protein